MLTGTAMAGMSNENFGVSLKSDIKYIIYEGKYIIISSPGQHAVVLSAYGRRVRPVRPVEENLLVRRAGLAEDWTVVALVEVAPHAAQAGRDVVTLQHAGRHPQVVQLGQDLTVQVGQGVAGQEGGRQTGQEVVQLGQGDLQSPAVSRHRLRKIRVKGLYELFWFVEQSINIMTRSVLVSQIQNISSHNTHHKFQLVGGWEGYRTSPGRV